MKDDNGGPFLPRGTLPYTRAVVKRPEAVTPTRVVPRDVGGPLASGFYERIKLQIKELEESKREDEVVQVEIALTDGSRLAVLDLGYHNPTLLTLTCVYDDGTCTKVLAHFSTVQLLLSVSRADGAEKKRRAIGFLGGKEDGE